ncbi:nuclear transport factor 2 family protein [Streptomyces sp. Go-475]|uniref:nuclear transport factor 2 family protein n=1 Tax=Streptomyces sp. Go-475 TaxID=2072505 RepID=UPI000DEF3C91|nr:nuclear transport factor 2 family protein [Streptomyces sp. Go-475]AXE86848.1 SnoaL-like domain protein [Streptomyces sp. Go-475]
MTTTTSGTTTTNTTTATSPTTTTSTSEATRATVRKFLELRLAGDTAGLTALFADEVDWMLAENPGVPWIRPRSTAAECAAQAEELARYTVPEEARASVDAFLVDGTDAVLTGHVSGTVRATGKSFSGPFALRLTVENGRITRHHLYENSVSIAAACAP